MTDTQELAGGLLLASATGMTWPRAGFALQIVLVAVFLVKNGLT